ncbi:hypothetical protein KUV85_13745 [Nocardioides panacisoli]|nr:hypothetical protein [Nocardioides panacisoli]QYJ03385.1 hypothetical protein KUV85_13745 [Nocardioides panacisoli]
MDTKSLASAIIGFLLGGLTVSVAAQLDDDADQSPQHGSSSQVTVVR